MLVNRNNFGAWPFKCDLAQKEGANKTRGARNRNLSLGPVLPMLIPHKELLEANDVYRNE